MEAKRTAVAVSLASVEEASMGDTHPQSRRPIDRLTRSLADFAKARGAVRPADDGGYSGGSTERPALQRLLADVRTRKVDVIVVYKVMLGVERVEVLLKPMLGRYASVNGAADRLGRPALHGRASDCSLSRRPKNLGPFQREPVMAKATLDRLA